MRSQTQAVAGAAQRMNQLLLVIVVDLAAEAAHENFEHVGKGVVVVVPHVRGDGRPIDHAILVQDEELQEREFLRGQRDLATGAPCAMRAEVDFEIGDADDVLAARQPSSDRAQSREEFGECKRFREIVIGAGVETAHTVVDAVSRRQHQYRRHDAPLSERPAEIEPRSARQHHIEYDDVQIVATSSREAVGELHPDVDLVAPLLQPLAENGGQSRIIFDEQCAHAGKVHRAGRIARPGAVIGLSGSRVDVIGRTGDAVYCPWVSRVFTLETTMRSVTTIIGIAAIFAAANAGAQAAKPQASASKPRAAPQARTTGYKKELPDALVRVAKVTEATAAATALAQVPGGKIETVELEREDAKLIYSYDIKVPGKSGIDEVHIDAMTGAVASNVHETPAMEKQEAAADKKEAKAKAATAKPAAKPVTRKPPL